MKYVKYLFLILFIFLLNINITYAAKFYPATALTGGGVGALDKIDGAILSNADVAFVVLENDATYENALLIYVLDADSAAAESSPSVISPDTNPGNKRWELSRIIASTLQTGGSSSPTVEFLDSDAPGSDKEIGDITVEYVDGGDGSENSDIYIYIWQGGVKTLVLQFDESDDRWEIPTGKHFSIGAVQWDNGSDYIDGAAIEDNGIGSGKISTVVDSMYWDAGGMTPDGTQCADAAKVTINSGPAQYTIICADNDASTIYGHVVLLDSWDAGTITFELEYLQTAADTNALNSDIACECRGAGETVDNTWGTEQAIDDAGVTGSNAVDHTTSAAVTCNGTCAAGDTIYWRLQIDATGTTTAVATLHILGMKAEYTSNFGD